MTYAAPPVTAANFVGRLSRAGYRLFLALFLFTLFLVTFDMRHWMWPPVFVGVSALLIGGAFFLLRRSDFRTFVLYIVFFNLFNGLRTLADNTGRGVSYGYPVKFDTTLFGAEPSSWLQAHLYTPGHLNVLGWATLAVYTTYFTGHFVIALLLWRVKREWLARFVTAIIVTLYVGLLLYFLIPTAPPWLASEHGDGPAVVRVATASHDHVLAGAYSRGSRVAGENDVGAMPSLHIALTVIIALTALRSNRRLGLIGAAYVAAMGFSLVYLGEHYVADVLAGSAIAVGVWRFLSRRSESEVRSQQTPMAEAIAERPRQVLDEARDAA